MFYSIPFQTLCKEKLFIYPLPLRKFASFTPLYPLEFPWPSEGVCGYFLEPHIICGLFAQQVLQNITEEEFPTTDKASLLIKKSFCNRLLLCTSVKEKLKFNYKFLLLSAPWQLFILDLWPTTFVCDTRQSHLLASLALPLITMFWLHCRVKWARKLTNSELAMTCSFTNAEPKDPFLTFSLKYIPVVVTCFYVIKRQF